ncbi:hypothetical protein [Xanthobacter sediminis]
MDDLALLAARVEALSGVSYPLGSRHKSFARAIQQVAPGALTERQQAHVARLCWRYRRQIPAHLVPPANPDSAARPPAAEAPPAPTAPPPAAEPAAPPDLFSFFGSRPCT